MSNVHIGRHSTFVAVMFMATCQLMHSPASGNEADKQARFGNRVSVALDAISQLNVPRAESSIEELDRLLQANQTLSPWRKERQRRAVDELRFLSRRLTTHTANVTEFASQFALARRAAARKQMAVSKWHGSRALKALASFKSDTPEFYYDVARYYVGACSSLNVFEPDDFSFDEFDTFATEAWGHESGHAGVVKSWQLTLRMKMSNGDGVDLTEFVTALRMMQEVRDVHSDEYSIAAGLYALRLIQLRRFQQALEMCDEVLTDSVVVLANRSLDWGGSIVIYRIRAAALSGLGRHADAQKEFRISQRNSYGRIGMEHCLKAVIALESESFGDADKFRTMLNRDWKCRKEMSVSDGFADDATTAGNWVETGFVTTSELKRVGSRLKEVGNVQLALRSGDYSRATELLSAYVPASGDSAHSKLYPVCDHNWLSQDSPALRELNRAPATSNSRRAIQMAWAALDNDARAVALLSENLELGSTALKRDFGPKSASLWYFHRAAAKALRESGMFRQASEQLSQARSVLSAAGKIQSPFGIVQSTEEMVLAALLGDDSVDPKKYVLSREIKLPRTIAFLPLRAHEAMAMGMNCVVGKDFAGAEAFGSHADFLCRHEHLQEYNGPDFTTPLAQALRGAAYAHYGETESAEKEFASMKLALEGGEGIRAPELRWFALKLYADFLEKEGKTARAKKIRQLSEAELPDREGR